MNAVTPVHDSADTGLNTLVHLEEASGKTRFPYAFLAQHEQTSLIVESDVCRADELLFVLQTCQSKLLALLQWLPAQTDRNRMSFYGNTSNMKRMPQPAKNHSSMELTLAYGTELPNINGYRSITETACYQSSPLGLMPFFHDAVQYITDTERSEPLSVKRWRRETLGQQYTEI